MRALETIPAAGWASLLAATDQTQLTLPLGIRCRTLLPDFVRDRIDRNLTRNAERYRRIASAQSEIMAALQSEGLDFVILKGLTQWPWYSKGPEHRPQYDIDIYCPDYAIARALKTIGALGYEAVGTAGYPYTDHLPAMIRKTGFVWSGDYYDPELPPSVELHFRFWNPQTTGFDLAGLKDFWNRRTMRDLHGREIPALSIVDGLSYSALHMVRHLLSGDLKAYHVYELAHFLNNSAADDSFWHSWVESGAPDCRRVAAIAFRLAREWFAPSMHPAVCETLERMPSRVEQWFEVFGWAPLSAAGQTDKSELWLQLLLADPPSARWGIARRRLLPSHHGRRLTDPHIPVTEINPGLRLKRRMEAVGHFFARVVHHALALGPALVSGWRWWRVAGKSL